ncbi:hypothetical protein DPMN_113659 [Dreissena polymorpha]|uniref:Uncharacterized protein n=1 Tax=Dreissena polymorpha TaxID=45954 RepID=A0A9D4KIR7_DREPO|nr:hypothetical protein DPMN_113659 [Dreissena polymorpha]
MGAQAKPTLQHCATEMHLEARRVPCNSLEQVLGHKRAACKRDDRAEATERERSSDYNMPGSTVLQVLHPQGSRDASEKCRKTENKASVNNSRTPAKKGKAP